MRNQTFSCIKNKTNVKCNVTSVDILHGINKIFNAEVTSLNLVAIPTVTYSYKSYWSTKYQSMGGKG